MMPKVSLVIPVYNEDESLPALFEALDKVVPTLPSPVEVVVVDDGSSDGSFALLKEACRSRAWLRVVRFRRNYGQTAALAAGIDHTRAPVLVALDADLQNDPADIPAMLAKLDEGYDVVSGWRKDRQDKALSRKLPSAIANRIIGKVSGLALHDYGCTLKAYRRFVLEPYTLYGEMHRFIPIYASWTGAKVTEMVVRHHPRVAGKSKYGIGRVYKVLLDLLTVSFLGGYSTKPIYFFGKPAMFLSAAGFASFGLFVFEFVYARVTHDFEVWVQPTTLLLFAVFTVTLGVQLVLMGLLGEIVMRTYYESQSKKTYLVRETEGFGAPIVEARDALGTAPADLPLTRVG